MSVDLSTNYLGLSLRNPIVASAGPIQQTTDGVKALADAGVGAVVMYSLFEEQVRHEEARMAEVEMEYMNSFAESLSFFPTVASNAGGITEKYLRHLEASVKAVDVPVIGSLNAAGVGNWVKTAHRMQDAGAAALECNIYAVPDIGMSGPEIEDRHIEIVSAVKDAIDIPVAVKVLPFFSAPGNMMLRLAAAGADGLVMFNRFLQPDIDIETLGVESGGVAVQQGRAAHRPHVDRRHLQTGGRLHCRHLGCGHPRGRHQVHPCRRRCRHVHLGPGAQRRRLRHRDH